jgi:hypothetical protein
VVLFFRRLRGDDLVIAVVASVPTGPPILASGYDRPITRVAPLCVTTYDIGQSYVVTQNAGRWTSETSADQIDRIGPISTALRPPRRICRYADGEV